MQTQGVGEGREGGRRIVAEFVAEVVIVMVLLALRETVSSMLLQLKVQHAFDGGDGLSEAAMERLVRAHHAENAFCEEGEISAFASKAWHDAQPSSSRALHRPLDREAFEAWYDVFLAFLENEKTKPKKAHGGDAAVGSSSFTGDATWTVPMASMQDALEDSWAKGRTPLLIDMTADGGDSTPMETFFAYSGDKVIDLKRLVIEVDVRKEKSCEEALEEMRAKLVLAMRRGYHLVLMLSNSAPRLRSRFSSSAHMPYTLLEDNAEVQRVIGAEAEDWRHVGWSRDLLTEDDQVYVVHQDFNVLAITRFAPDVYEGYLGKELPLQSMQHIRVTL